MKIGNMELENVKASTNDSNSPALIGNEFLEKYTIVMDFVNKNMAFVPSENKTVMMYC